ncbi:MAG: nitroreductase family protein [Bacteroidetes bacterium]|nr:nitroreductase family protein [Bacteroidota bacterium]
MIRPEFIPYKHPCSFSEAEMKNRAEEFRDDLRERRTVRSYSERAIPEGVIEYCLEAALTAPSGANQQPWHFVVIRNPAIKKKIRTAAEAEERAFYSGRAPDEWLEALRSLGTDEHKPFLETAPVLIAIFAKNYEIRDSGQRRKNYYVQESVGISTGILITALHRCGLSMLTNTPSPMGFLNEILDRPVNERAYLLLVVGYASDDAVVPEIEKKKLSDVASFF